MGNRFAIALGLSRDPHSERHRQRRRAAPLLRTESELPLWQDHAHAVFQSHAESAPAAWGAVPTTGVGQRAHNALEDLCRGCQALQGADLDPGAVRVLEDLRCSIHEFETYVQDARISAEFPWPRPLPEEQADWENLCPGGGVFLRAQVCLAADGVSAKKWVMGRLCISDKGLLFEGGAGLMPNQDKLQTGLLPWTEIIALERRSLEGIGSAHEVVLTLAHIPLAMSTSTLQLQLRISCDSEWLEETWVVCRSRAQARNTETFVSADGTFVHNTFVGNDDDGSQAIRTSLLGSRTSIPAAQTPLAVGRSPSTRSSNNRMPVSFHQAVAHAPSLSDAQLNQSLQQADHKERISGVSLPQVIAVLELDEWPFHDVLQQSAQSYDMVWTPMVESRRVPGTFHRRCKFKMPIPPDVPRAVSAIVGSPELMHATAVYSVRISDDDICILQHTSAQGVTYGDDFRIQDVFSFRVHPAGVEYRKSTQVVWAAELPWKHNAVKTFVDKKVKSSSMESAQLLSQLLVEGIKAL